MNYGDLTSSSKEVILVKTVIAVVTCRLVVRYVIFF